MDLSIPPNHSEFVHLTTDKSQVVAPPGDDPDKSVPAQSGNDFQLDAAFSGSAPTPRTPQRRPRLSNVQVAIRWIGVSEAQCHDLKQRLVEAGGESWGRYIDRQDCVDDSRE